jgi:hypothetical protein
VLLRGLFVPVVHGSKNGGDEVSDHVHDENCQPAMILCGPSKLEYLVYSHRRGARKSELAARKPTVAGAFSEVAKVIARDKFRELNRVYICASEVEPSYYEPHLVYEVHVR